MDKFSSFLNMNVCCVFLLESPHRGDSNENTNYTIYHFQFKNNEENHPRLS